MKNEEAIETKALAIRERENLVLTPVMDVNTAIKKLEEFQGFCAHYLQESQDGGNDGGDYGIIPGTKKKTLLKSGADKLCEVYGLYDTYEFVTTTENWEKGLFDYTVKCVLRSRRDDSLVGTGLGSCSSYESKYRYRDSSRKCPKCGSTAIIKGKEEYGGGWLCFAKKGGCGAKFGDKDPAIVGQTIGKIVNEDIADTKNTILKMAKKRAKIDGVISVTRSSGLFTQDMEDAAPVRSEVKPGSVTPAKSGDYTEAVLASTRTFDDGWMPPEEAPARTTEEVVKTVATGETVKTRRTRKAKAEPAPQPNSEPEAPPLPIEPPPVAKPNGQPAPVKLPPPITQGHITRLWARATAAGWTKDQVHDLARHIVINGKRLESVTELPQGAQYYERFISILDKGAPSQ